jgi:hypothetical protein
MITRTAPFVNDLPHQIYLFTGDGMSSVSGGGAGPIMIAVHQSDLGDRIRIITRRRAET